MDAINTASLYDAFVRKFSIGQNSLTRFQASFLSAYNDCLMDLFNESLIEEPVLLEDTGDNSTLEIRFLPQIKDGIKFFLQTSGEWVKGDDVDKYAGLAWERAKGVISNVLTKADQDASTYTGPWGDVA